MKKKNNFLLYSLLSGITIHLINSKIFQVSSRRLADNRIGLRYYNWKFGHVSYRQEGTGSPLLLIHDTFSGASSIEFEKLTHKLARQHTVYAIDLLGYGFSEKVNITHTAYLYVQLIQDFITNVIQENGIDVITSGHSNMFALLTAQQDKSLIKKIIMINPIDLRSAAIKPSKRDKTAKYLLEFPFIGTSLYNLLHCRIHYRKLFFANGNIKSYISRFYDNAHNGNVYIRYAFASQLCNYMNQDIKKAVLDSDISLYVINGRNRSLDYQIIESSYRNLNPSIEFETIKNSIDLPHLENSNDSYAVIQLFLAS